MAKDCDSDVRRLCQTCRGPVYMDEPGSYCPDCRSALDAMAAAHGLANAPRPKGVPAVLERVVRVSAGD